MQRCRPHCAAAGRPHWPLLPAENTCASRGTRAPEWRRCRHLVALFPVLHDLCRESALWDERRRASSPSFAPCRMSPSSAVILVCDTCTALECTPGSSENTFCLDNTTSFFLGSVIDWNENSPLPPGLFLGGHAPDSEPEINQSEDLRAAHTQKVWHPARSVCIGRARRRGVALRAHRAAGAT